MTYASYDHVLNGRTQPLTPAPCTLAVWRPVLCPALLVPPHRTRPLHCYHEARGYRFAWGHVIESVAPPDPEFAEGLVMWDFRPGGRADTVSGPRGQPGRARGYGPRLPGCVHAAPCPTLAVLWRRRPAGRLRRAGAGHASPSARLWLWTFLTDGMPRLLASVLAINVKAGHARGHDRGRCTRPAGTS